jgi:hypothetical protein
MRLAIKTFHIFLNDMNEISPHEIGRFLVKPVGFDVTCECFACLTDSKVWFIRGFENFRVW